MTSTSRSDNGFSLLELMFVCMLLGVTMAAAWTVMSGVSMMSNRMSARATATDESRVFVGTMGNELLQAANLKSLGATATANADAQGAFYDIQPRRIGFYADLNHDGKPERIAYYMSGVSLFRQQATASTTTYPFSWAASSAPTPVVQKVDPSWSGPIFTYYASGAWPPAQITGASQVASITLVAVEMWNIQTWSDQTISYAASTTARVRGIGNGF